MARKHMLEFVQLQKVWAQYTVQVAHLIDSLDTVSQWLPSNKTTLRNIVHFCKDNIEGVTYEDRIDHANKGWTLAPQYEQKLQAKMDSATARLRALDPTYEPPTIEKKKPGGCYIVTATMGNRHHPTVALMRRLRDKWIEPKAWGPSFVRTYYRLAPSAARLIEKSPRLRKLSYSFIVTPTDWIVERVLGRKSPLSATCARVTSLGKRTDCSNGIFRESSQRSARTAG